MTNFAYCYDTSADTCRTSRAVTPLRASQWAPQQLELDPLPNLRLSAHKTARASMPFTQSGLEFELMQSHPYSYSAQRSDFASLETLRGLEVRALFSDIELQSM